MQKILYKTTAYLDDKINGSNPFTSFVYSFFIYFFLFKVKDKYEQSQRQNSFIP